MKEFEMKKFEIRKSELKLRAIRKYWKANSSYPIGKIVLSADLWLDLTKKTEPSDFVTFERYPINMDETLKEGTALILPVEM